MQKYFSQMIENRDPHFISDIFFLTSYAHSIGFGPLMEKYSHIENGRTLLQRKLDIIANSGQPVTIPMTDAEDCGPLEVMNCIMNDRVNQEKSLNFLCLVTKWLLKFMDEKNEYLGSKIPIEWKCLPEFLMQIVLNHAIFIMRFY